MNMRVCAAVVSTLAGAACAQTAANGNMTYQGSLKDSGLPANGVYDFRIVPYNTALGGTPIGLSNCFDQVSVVDGLFTLTVNPAVFDGRAMWFEILVREDAANAVLCSTGAFSTLSPRQPVTAAPIASALVLPIQESVSVPGTSLWITNSSDTSNAVALHGMSTASTSSSTAVMGTNASSGTNAIGVHGRIASATPGAGSVGVMGTITGPTSGTGGIGVYGYHIGAGVGVRGDTTGGTGVAGIGRIGVDGLSTDTGVDPIAVRGRSYEPTGTGVRGEHNATTGTAPGVFGGTNSSDPGAVGVIGYVIPSNPGAGSAAVMGVNLGTNGNGSGVHGRHIGTGRGVEGIGFNGTGVRGEGLLNGIEGIAWPSTPTNYGVRGTNSNTAGVGILGEHTATTGTQPGVWGTTDSTSASATAVLGQVEAIIPGVNAVGVRGVVNSTTSVEGSGVRGEHNGTGVGVYGYSTGGVGVFGTGQTKGVRGYGDDVGVEGFSNIGAGVFGLHSGTADTSPGVLGATLSTEANAVGVKGEVRPTSPGVFSAGVRGENWGVGGSGVGVYGWHAGFGYGVYGTTTSAAGYAGYFSGRVAVTGVLTKGSGAFKIDHPLDPENKFLSHSFVESPDMMNIYNGVVTTDDRGYATITMPDWFEALNQDFRYQLTVIDTTDSEDFVMTKVVRPIEGNRFTLRASKGGVQVSWQVTGIRHDALARDHRIPNEEVKSESERGMFLYPQGFGFGEDRQIGRIKPQDTTGQ